MIDRIYWHVPGRILVAVYTGHITPTDLDDSFVRIRQMVNAEGLPPYVHLIGESSARTGFDPEMFKLSTIARITNLQEDKSKFGWVILVDAHPHPIMQFIISAITQLTGSRYRVFRDLESALAFLMDIDTTLITPLEPSVNVQPSEVASVSPEPTANGIN